MTTILPNNNSFAGSHLLPERVNLRSSESTAPDSGSAIASIAKAIADARTCLAGTDCEEMGAEACRIMLARAREVAREIGSRPYGGLAIFADPDDGTMELIFDSLRTERRLTIVYRVSDSKYRVICGEGAAIQAGPWIRLPYDVQGLAAWLVGEDA